MDLEHAKQKTKGRKSLAPKQMDDKSSIGTDNEADRPATVGEFPSISVKGSDQPTQDSSRSSKEEEAQVEEAPKTEENKENLVTVSSAKLVGSHPNGHCLQIKVLIYFALGSTAVLGCCFSKAPTPPPPPLPIDGAMPSG